MCLNFGQMHCKNPQFKIALKRIYIHKEKEGRRQNDILTKKNAANLYTVSSTLKHKHQNIDP